MTYPVTTTTTTVVMTTATAPHTSPSPPFSQGIWSQHEHDLFLKALRTFPHGPWKRIADFVGTRSVRQVQTHAQKYNEKVMRRLRTGPKDRKTRVRVEHRVDDEVLSFCTKLGSGCLPRRRVAVTAAAINAASAGTGDIDGSDRAWHAAAKGVASMYDDDYNDDETETETDASSQAMSEFWQSQDDSVEGLAWEDLHTTGLDALSIDDSLDYLITALLAAE